MPIPHPDLLAGKVRFPSLFVVKQKRGVHGVLDGLKYDYLEKVFCGKKKSASFDLQNHLRQVWWWTDGWGRRPKMVDFWAMNSIAHMEDGGVELAYSYEAIARCSGAYPYGKPFTMISSEEIREFLTQSGITASEGNADGVIMEPYRHPQPCLDPWFFEPEFRIENGGCFSAPFFCVLNLKQPEATIMDELRLEIRHLKAAANITKTKKGGPRAVPRKMELLEAWDCSRWQQDRPDDPALRDLPQFRTAGGSYRLSGFGNVRRTTLKRFKWLREWIVKHPPQ